MPRPTAAAFESRRARRAGARLRAAGIALVLLGVAGTSRAQPVAAPDSLLPPTAPHPLGVRDLWALERVSDPQPSPDGSRVAYVLKGFDVRTNKSHSNIWVVATSGSASRRLTEGEANDTNPRWSPDGYRVAFLSDRGGSGQIWSVDVDGGEAESLTDLPVAVESFAWSPHGESIVFAAGVYPDCETLECTNQRKQKQDGDAIAARRYDHLLFRHWDAWDSGRRQHLFVVPADGGTPVDLLPGADLDAPPSPMGGVEAYAWSPDEREVAFQGRMHGAQISSSTDTNVFVANVDGSGFRCITSSNLASDGVPVWSSDGRRIAYLAMARAGYESDRWRVALYDVKEASRRILTETWDRSPSELAWSPSGRDLVVSVADSGRRSLYAIDAETGEPRAIPHPGSATAPRPYRGGDGERIVFVGESLVSPPDLYTCKLDGSGLVRLTEANATRMAAIQMSKPESVWCEGAKGVRVHAWLHPPVGRRDGGRYPLVLLVHGGPQGSWDDRFSFRWNPQVFAGAGFAVLAPDPRGSVGYGQGFTDDINGDWGGAAYEDLMKSLQHVLNTVPWVDSTHVGAAGGSFGGYMMFWMAGHTDRFRALVSHAGVYDLSSFYGTTEEQWLPEWEFGGTPWDNPEEYARWSPDQFVKNWKTPMLVTQGGRDYRVPETQSFAAFTALQRRGVPSELLTFPAENHWVQKPQNSILWYDAVLGWLDRWLRVPESSAPRPAP